MLRRTIPVAAVAGLWWLLTDGDPASWLVGAPTVAAAAWVMHRTAVKAPGRISLLGSIRFLPYFILESVRGGVDVAWRTLGPRLRVRPGFLEYRSGLRRPEARVFFANCVSLLPGTLAADLRGDLIHLHLLDHTSDVHSDLKRLERAVERIYPNPEPIGEN